MNPDGGGHLANACLLAGGRGDPAPVGRGDRAEGATRAPVRRLARHGSDAAVPSHRPRPRPLRWCHGASSEVSVAANWSGPVVCESDAERAAWRIEVDRAIIERYSAACLRDAKLPSQLWARTARDPPPRLFSAGYVPVIVRISDCPAESGQATS